MLMRLSESYKDISYQRSIGGKACCKFCKHTFGIFYILGKSIFLVPYAIKRKIGMDESYSGQQCFKSKLNAPEEARAATWSISGNRHQPTH